MPLPGVGVFGGSAPKPVLEIKPDSTFVVFYGAPNESQVAELTGKLVLTNYEAMNVRSIKLGLLGMRRTSWSTTNTITPQPILTKLGFHREDKNLFPAEGSKNKPHKINPGVHEWSFCFKMPSTLDESVEGIDTNWIVYNLNATVDRGYLTKQLTATKHIRVVRTLGRDMLETQPMEQINEDIWASKLAYKITVPQKNYIVGTSITADFVLIPLRKGVEISNIRMDLVEARTLWSEYAGRRISHSYDQIIVQKDSTLPPNSIQALPGDDENADHLFDEAHRFQMTLDLPKSLRKCRQSVDSEFIRITHKLRIYVNLHNPEGHTSQLLVKNHIHLFISPNLPPNEDQSVSVDQGHLSSQQMREEALQHAPPTYGQHQLDELYMDIDPSGFMTPGGRGTSGANTPFYGHSRQGSIEDLAALNSIAQQADGGASISALHSRLNNLNISENRSPWQHSSGGSTPGGYFAGVDVYDMEALVRTPSYNTAVRTPARTPSGDLPTYEIATSRPSSPTHTPRSGHTSPSPTRSLDTLAEETERNTELNSRRTSPSRSGRNSDEQR